jgi:hypothetical protein
MRTDLTVVTASDEAVIESTRLTAHCQDLMTDWGRGIDRLRDLLGSIFPAPERAFDYSVRSPLILLTGFQTPDAVRVAGEPGRLARCDRATGTQGTPLPAASTGIHFACPKPLAPTHGAG